MIIPADKTTNYYLVDKDDYLELRNKNITKDYKKAGDKLFEETTKADLKIASELNIADRVHITSKQDWFVNLKDHKPNFHKNPKCRLINPTKSFLGRVAKQKLQSIVENVRNKTKLIQWKNTSAVIRWFKNLSNPNNKLTFIEFDIVDYYPSITKEIFENAIHWARNYTEISDGDIELFYQTKKSLLYCDEEIWTKKENSDFDNAMGGYDSAELCDLVGLYLLSKINTLDIEAGLYRDDGLAVVDLTKYTRRQVENFKKSLCKIFQETGLKITVEANHERVNFLDITLDLPSMSYWPYIKDNNIPRYVHRKSNHPRSIINNIPKGVNRRLSENSTNETLFKAAIPVYQDAFKNAGYDYAFKYEPPKEAAEKPKKNRQRRKTYFNPPFSKNLRTNVGQQFLKIIDKCFPPGSKLNKIFNRNKVKLSYRTMNNLGSIISKHNKQILNQNKVEVVPPCNCDSFPIQGYTGCPLENQQCKKESVIYNCKVTSEEGIETYTGLTGGQIKTRISQHTTDAKYAKNENNTTLSKHLHKLKNEGKAYQLKWSLLDRGPVYNPITRKCRLCLLEKFYIIFKTDTSSLNRRSELFNTCRHRVQKILEKSQGKKKKKKP